MFDRVKTLLMNVLDVDEDRISMDTLLREELDVDSLDMVEIAIEIESEFDIQVDDRAVDNIRTVSDLCDAIENAIGE